MSLDLLRPAKVAQIRQVILAAERDGDLEPLVALFGGNEAVRRAVATIRHLPHPPNWTSWDEASALYDRFAEYMGSRSESESA